MAEVVTGEAVVLDLTIARFPSRMVALLLDMAVELPLLYFIEIVVFKRAAQHLNAASADAIYTAGLVFVLVGYPTIFETLTRGKTLGKMAFGLRVVSDDGGPIRFRQALIRGLMAAFVEIWNPLLCFVGLMTAMISAKGKRLGDMVAGTFVISERVPRRQDLPDGLAVVPPQLADWARNLELSRLTDHTAAVASGYVRRFHDLRPAARDQLGLQLATTVAAQVSPLPPPGTPPIAYLAAVLAVRRDREQARFRSQHNWQPGADYAAVPGLAATTPAATTPTLTTLPAASPGMLPAIPAGPLPAGPLPAGPLPAGPLPVGQPPARPPKLNGEQHTSQPPPIRPNDFGFAAPF